jgi:hyperosmotically inducible periplasmic protein
VNKAQALHGKQKQIMKRTLPILFTATAASLLTFTVLAQDDNTPKSDRPLYARDYLAHPKPHASRLHSAAKASDVIGMTVKNYQDEKLGTVEDLAVDVESGRIVQVILSTGGFIGVGDRLSAVPPGALHHDVTNKVLHLDANKEKLQSAPEFKAAKWTECCDSDHLSAVYTYYGQEPAFKFIHKGDLNDGSANTSTTRNTDGTWNKARLTGERQWMIPAARLTQIQKASKLMGIPVKNAQDEKLGTVDNLLVDVQAGRIVAVVVTSGGFIGIGEELSAVPPTACRFNAGNNSLQLDTTKEQLSAAPHFKADQWPDFSQPMYSDRVYRAYRMEPYFNTNALPEADNTARNVRDRNNRTITPFDQGNSQADTDITAQIRKGINAGKDLSVNAKNVKVITNNGRVTLRGPVNNSEEKRMIGAIADGIARAENVDNQLEVTFKNLGN